MKSKKVLLTGASGTVGLEVLSQLLGAVEKYEVFVFDKRSPLSEKRLKPFGRDCQVIYGDVSNPADVQLIPRELDVVIHLAAIIPPLADDLPKLAWKVNFEGTKTLVEQLISTSPTCFFMFSSSISVYGDRVSNPLIQIGDPLQPSFGDEYAKTKIATEEMLINSGLDYTIFRLAAIMGGHKMSKLMFHQPLNTSLEIATPADTARAFVNGIDHQSELSHKIFNLGGGESCRTSYEGFLQRSFNIFGLGKLNFPDKAFADYNFHCGFYADGDELDAIVKFRQDNLNDYFKNEQRKVSGIEKIAAKLFRPIIKYYLLKQSEPYHAHNHNSVELKKRFFKT